MTRGFRSALVGIGLAVATIGAASAQTFPDKPIRVVLGFPAGSGNDVIMRLIQEPLSKALGQNVIIEPRTGAGGNVGAEYVKNAPPDGYTLFFSTAGTHAINATLYRNLPFDPVKDFESVALLCDVPNILIVNNDVPVKSVQEFIAAAKAQPGKINYGSSGNGSSMHLTGAQFQAATKVDIVHVPYRGSPAATADLLAGQIQAMFHQVPTVIGQVKQGQVRPLAVTSAQRLPALPDVPTMSESGLPGFTSTTWYGISAPAKTPKPIIDRLNKEINAVLASEKEKIEATGVTVRIVSPEEMDKVLKEDIARWRDIVVKSGAKLD